MHDEDLCFRSTVDLAPYIRSRRLSPVELARAVTARIAKARPDPVPRGGPHRETS